MTIFGLFVFYIFIFFHRNFRSIMDSLLLGLTEIWMNVQLNQHQSLDPIPVSF